MKICTKCKQEKPDDAFYKKGSNCRVCHRLYYVGKLDKKRERLIELPLANFNEKLKQAREEKQWSQEKLGELVGVARRQVTAWEKGHSLPRQLTLKKIYAVLGWELPIELQTDPKGLWPYEIRNCEICNKRFPVFKLGVTTCSAICGTEKQVRDKRGYDPDRIPGTYTHVSGYIKVKLKGHPYADQRGYVLKHRLIMEQKLGRYLEPHERIHHMNGDRSDNRPENLELWKVKGMKDPAGVRAADYHCAGCMCSETSSLKALKKFLVENGFSLEDCKNALQKT